MPTRSNLHKHGSTLPHKPLSWKSFTAGRRYTVSDRKKCTTMFLNFWSFGFFSYFLIMPLCWHLHHIYLARSIRSEILMRSPLRQSLIRESCQLVMGKQFVSQAQFAATTHASCELSGRPAESQWLLYFFAWVIAILYRIFPISLLILISYIRSTNLMWDCSHTSRFRLTNLLPGLRRIYSAVLYFNDK